MRKFIATLVLIAATLTGFSQTIEPPIYRYSIEAFDDVGGDQIYIDFNVDLSYTVGETHSIQFSWSNLPVGPTWTFVPGPVWQILKEDQDWNDLLNRVEFGTKSSIDTPVPFAAALLNGTFYFDWPSVVTALNDMGFSVTVEQVPNCICESAPVENGLAKGHKK